MVEDTRHEGELLLAPVPESAAAARRFIRRAIDGHARRLRATDIVAVAQLLTSELVTNALLHGGGPVRLLAAAKGERLRVGVSDPDPSEPTTKPFGLDAETGRGMVLVEALASQWGVEQDTASGGKTVWFELALDRGTPSEGKALDDAPPPDMLPSPAADGDPRGADPTTDACVVVRMLGVPVALYIALEAHNDAVMRELRLLAEGADRAKGVPGRLVELADVARRNFGDAAGAIRRQVDEAAAAGAATVDIETTVPRRAGGLVEELGRMLDEADDFCGHGDLLTLNAPSEVRRFRQWYTAEVSRQLSGDAPRPWPREDPSSDPTG